MPEQKKDTPVLAQTSAPINFPTNIIPQPSINNQVKSKKSNKKNTLCVRSNVYTLGVKCYDEQLVYGWEKTKELIRSIDKSKYQVLSIRHDRDIVTDGIWLSATEKPHIHTIFRCTDRKTRIHISTILNSLGIYFRPQLDDDLWMNHGVETVGNFTGYAVYLTHETEQAVIDGKELYDITEIVSNLSQAEIIQIRDGYTRVSDHSHKLTTEELEALDANAYSLGYELKNFLSWYSSQPFTVRSNAKMKTIRESYERGVEARIEENEELNRVCLFIQGAPNTGKTYATKKALGGLKVLSIGGGGSGKFDKLRPDHDAIVIDDDVCPNLLNMTDNYICHAYKRNSSNPAWSGKYFIVTSNLPFKDWLRTCGIHVDEGNYGRESQHYKAMVSRFSIGRVVKSESGVNQLYIEHLSTRGSDEDRAERKKLIREFMTVFNKTISAYSPKVDLSDDRDIIIDFTKYGLKRGF